MDPAIIGIVMIISTVIATPIIIKVARSHKCNYGEVKDGYQYCTTCNKARVMDALNCRHKWKTISMRNIATSSRSGGQSRITGEIHIMECEKCGDKKDFTLSIN